MVKRKFKYSKLYKFVEFEGTTGMLVPVFDDLDHELLLEHYLKAMEDEDYEYAGACLTHLFKMSPPKKIQ